MCLPRDILLRVDGICLCSIVNEDGVFQRSYTTVDIDIVTLHADTDIARSKDCPIEGLVAKVVEVVPQEIVGGDV